MDPAPYASKRKAKIIVILGPTAAGKSALALFWAQRFDGKIISADALQVYRGMDIGTSKPTQADREAIPHHLIDIATPDEPITLADWQRRAQVALTTIMQAGKLPILVGGTGLYISSILENYKLPASKPDASLRKALERHATTSLYGQLCKIDPQTATRIDEHNRRRLVRALEHAITTGSSFYENQKQRPTEFEFCIIGCNLPQDQLTERINERVIAMVLAGLEREVKSLVRRYSWRAHPLTAIGYKEWREYLMRRRKLAEVIVLIQRNTRRLAKRQMTWFKKLNRRHDIAWVHATADAIPFVRGFLKS